MSICLQVIPSSAKIPTVKELKDEMAKLIVLETCKDDAEPKSLGRLTAQELADELKRECASMNSDDYCKLIWSQADVTHPNVLIEYVKSSLNPITQTEEILERCSDDDLSLSMDGFTYGWISIGNYKAGFDFYYDYDDSNFMYDYMVEIIELANKEDRLKKYFSLKAASHIHHSWTLRGSAGRSCASWLLAGMTAIALAKLTGGIVFSDDGGTDYSRLLTDPDDFLEWFPKWCYESLPH